MVLMIREKPFLFLTHIIVAWQEGGWGRDKSRKKLAPSRLYAGGEMQILPIPQRGYLSLQVSELCGRAALA